MIELNGKRIKLRDSRPHDADPLTHWLQPHHDWHKLNGPYYPPTPSHKIPELVEKWVSPDTPEIHRRLAIADIQTDAIMGMVSWYWISVETNWLAIGIVIYDPQNWRKGYGYESLGLWGDYLFDTMSQIIRLDLRTWSGNHGMMKLATKLGFVQEATFRKARIVDGQYYDGLGYGILREEWQERYPDGFASFLTGE